MCGICGSVNNSLEISALKSMVRILGHRGPDSSGIWTDSGTALGHTRLAIIDLTSSGSQPMVTPDGRYVLVYNGEIYNFRELRRILHQAGENFRSDSDTEVLLLGYRKWGRRFVEMIRGMFAFAIWNKDRQQLFLARDRLGVKPLFYAPLKKGLVFASEIKALFVHPEVRRQMNPSALDSYFELGYVPGPETIFSGIQALEPGCWLQFQNGDFVTGRYWTPDFRGKNTEDREQDLVEALDAKLNDAVSSHLAADVPVGAFLSGGIDSSLVCAIAQKHCLQPIHTFTIGFHGGDDEREFARAVADHIGSNHHEKLVTPDIIQELPRLMQFLEQPLFDNSILPTYLVSQHAREEVKVVLSGDGGDEPFGGYDWTRFALIFPEFAARWQPQGWQWAYERGLFGFSKRLIYDLSHGRADRYRRRTTVSAALRTWLYHPEFLHQIGGTVTNSVDHILRSAPVADPRDKFLYADLCRYLPEDVLYKVDRMSMANSLEVRVPLLDHLLLEWILRLPFEMRFRNLRGKYLLRKLAVRYLPPDVLKHRKQGFTVPLGRWLHGKLNDWVENLFRSPSFGTRGIVRPQAALEMLTLHRSRRYELSHRIWSLVILELWARIWLDGGQPNEIMHVH